MSIRLMLLTNYLKTARQLRFSTTTDEEEKDFNILGLNQRRASADCGPFIKTPRRKEVHAESAEISAAMRSESLKPELNTHLALIVLLAKPSNQHLSFPTIYVWNNSKVQIDGY